MGLEFLALCLLPPLSNAGFAAIQSMAYPKKLLALAPSGYPEILSGSASPQKLIIREPDGAKSSDMIPYFTARPDKTIAWDAMNLCIEAGGEGETAIGVGRCTGGPNQKWTLVSDSHGRNMIQLEGTKECLGVKEGGSNEFPIELRKCTSDLSEAWKFVEASAISEEGSSENLVLELRHMLIPLVALAGVGALSFSAWLMQQKSSATSATPLNAGQEGGVALVAPSTKFSEAPVGDAQVPGMFVIAASPVKSAKETLVHKRAEVKMNQNPGVSFDNDMSGWKPPAESGSKGIMSGGFEATDTPDFFDENSDYGKEIDIMDGVYGSSLQNAKKQNPHNPGIEGALDVNPDIYFTEEKMTDVGSVDFGLSSDIKMTDLDVHMEVNATMDKTITIDIRPVLMTYEEFYCGFTKDSFEGFSCFPTSGKLGRRGDTPTQIEVTCTPNDKKGEFKGTLCVILPDEKGFSTYYGITATCF